MESVRRHIKGYIGSNDQEKMILRLTNYILRKLLSAVPTLLGLSILIFYTSTFFPLRERVMLFISPHRYQDPWAPDPIPALIEKYHLNDPFSVQYVTWLGEVLKGNLGFSYLYDMPVAEAILKFFPATLELVIFAIPIILLGGYGLGVFSAKRAHKRAPREDAIDFATRTITTIGYSIPSFVLGLLLLVIFYVGLRWVGIERLSSDLQAFIFSPSSDWVTYTGLMTIDGLLNGRPDISLDALRHLVLPVITLATQMLAILVRITRSSMVGELVKPYIVTARAKGLDEKGVIRHAKKNSLASILTVSGILFASMLTGVVVTEYIFLIKGVGFLVVRAASRYDIALLVGLSLFFCVIFMLINLIVDIAYAYIDPRVKQ